MTRVMASGVFDILHSGHLHYLEEAKKLGDELVVVVATDSTVRRKKHEPITPERMRLELIQSLKPVDRAVLGREGDMLDIVLEIRPDIIAIGYDQRLDVEKIKSDLAKRGLNVDIVRLGEYSDDLNGTRKIIARIIDWHSKQTDKEGKK
ncbi:MAG: FAD synthase [Euryarchaeota archaeon]|nr:FAD synthase [Euryarchaeota archaeon]